MKHKLLLILPVLLLVLAIPVNQTAFAEENPSDEDLQDVATDAIAATIVIAGVGGVSGAILSLIRVMGKQMKDTRAEGFIFSKFLLTVLVGGGVGAALGAAGVSTEAALGYNFIVVFFVSQVLYPVFRDRKWKTK